MLTVKLIADTRPEANRGTSDEYFYNFPFLQFETIEAHILVEIKTERITKITQ